MNDSSTRNSDKKVADLRWAEMLDEKRKQGLREALARDGLPLPVRMILANQLVRPFNYFQSLNKKGLS